MKSKKIIEKLDGNVREFDNFELISNTINVNDISCYKNIFSQYSDVSDNVYNNIRSATNAIVSTAVSRRLDNKLFAADYMQMLKEVKTIDDFKNIYSLLIGAYTTNNSLTAQRTKTAVSRAEKIFNKYPDVAMSAFTLKIVVAYYTEKCSMLSKEQIESLENAKLAGIDMAEIAKISGEDFSENAKTNGVASLCERVFSNCIDEAFFKVRFEGDSVTHLCMSCDNARVDRCLKVATKRKLPIDQYDFIMDGYQVFDINDELDKFVVSNCNNYVEDKPRVNDDYVSFGSFKDMMSKYGDIINQCDSPVRVRNK